MPTNFQSRVIKPKRSPTAVNPTFESAQMQNPGKPVSITWKFANPMGAAPGAGTSMSSRVPPPTLTTGPPPPRGDELSRRPTLTTEPPAPPVGPPDEPYERPDVPPPPPVGPPDEPYERPEAPPPDEPRLDFQEPLDTAALTESALAPLWDKYKRARELAQSALSARGMGRSGALLGHENLGEEALFRSFVQEAGAITSHFALEAAKLGLSQQQIAIAERELALKEKSQGELLDWEKDKFAKQMAENSRQFNREYNLKETIAMDAAKQEWARIGLSQQEIDQRADQFNQTLLWQQEQFGMTFNWEQTKWLDQMAFSYKQLDQDMTQFNATLKQNLWIARENVRLQDKQLDLDEKYKNGLLSLQEYQNQTDRLRADNDILISQARLALDQWMAELSKNKIFGYWDPGYGPGEEDAFTGEKLEWNATLGQWVQTKEYAKFLAEHYHKGELDLSEMEIIIYGILGLTGSSNEEGEPGTAGDLPNYDAQRDMTEWFYPGGPVGMDRYNRFKDQFPDATVQDCIDFNKWAETASEVDEKWYGMPNFFYWKRGFGWWWVNVQNKTGPE